MIAVLMVVLYSSGLLAVVYMMLVIHKFDEESGSEISTKIAITDVKVTVVDIRL
ncbi:unnamed protein product [Gongylonema pulchrum]|uniref:Uncharacterized protein n=1 Tax=Gongylonema pulchrum TaxID=637853 RepID=A0A3P7M7U1_9BILA|nr:unnamed protein product [Gongylonema pulchrum]VDN34038.1 unnamed protein product [Gongylonema pulchrum]